MKSLFCFLILLTFTLACKAPEAPDPLVSSLDSVMRSAVDTARFNGNVLLAKDGKVVYQKSFGFANYTTKELLNDSSLFELASVSKQFTAMGIMILKERGQLAYEDDVRKFIPELPYEGITIRHLLNHTSGLPDYMEAFGMDKSWNARKIAFNKDIIAVLKKNKPPVLFKPGEKWEYSNTGYALLASVLEKVSGKPYGEFLKENIFVPVGMTRTRTYNTRRSTGEIIPNYAFGYVYSDSLQRFILPDSLPSYSFVITLDGIQGDGVVNSTTTDLFKWNEALYGEKLIKASTQAEAYTPAKLNNGSTYPYGFGWAIAQDSVAGKVVQHSGGWPGYGTFIYRQLDTKNCIIVLTNNDGHGRRTVLVEMKKRLNLK